MEELKKITIMQSKKLWSGRFEYLKNKHFIDSKGQLKKGVGSLRSFSLETRARFPPLTLQQSWQGKVYT